MTTKHDSNRTIKRESDFTMVRNDLLRYGTSACGNAQNILFIIILTMYDFEKKGTPIYPSQRRLADQMNLSTKQVSRIAKSLARQGLITIKTRWINDKRRNHYVVNYTALDDLLRRTKAEVKADVTLEADEPYGHLRPA